MLVQLGADTVVLIRRGHHRDGIHIFCAAADHARTADINLLDGLALRDALGCDRSLKRIEIDADQIDRLNAVIGHGLNMLRPVASGQKAAMHLGVKGLDPAVHHLGKTGHRFNGRHRDTGFL